MRSVRVSIHRYRRHIRNRLKFRCSPITSQSKSFCSASTNSKSTNQSSSSTESNQSDHSNGNDNKNWVEVPTLPCFLSQFDAMETFNIWARRQWFAPRSFRKDCEKYVHVIHKHYVPFWHFEASAQTRYHASVGPNLPPTKEAVTSCSYSSSSPEMQILASDRLTNDESRFPSIPPGPTQFQRMTHHLDDLLPDTVSEVDATNRVTGWLQKTETSRVYDFVTVQERLFRPHIESKVEHSCRKAYMPCFVIYFNPNVPNPKDKPDAITENIPTEATHRCIVHGHSGDIQGPKLYSLLPCTKVTMPLSFSTILPFGAFLMWYPWLPVTAASIMGGLFGAGIMTSPIFTSRMLRLYGDRLNTQQTRLKAQQLEEKEIEDILREAEKSWGSSTHRSRPIAREQQRAAQDSYDTWKEQGGGHASSEGARERGYDAEGRPIGRRAIRFIELYEVLGISPNASNREIQQAFTKMAKKYHPDQLQHKEEAERKVGEEKFQKILLAFQVLKDPDRRRKYDTTGSSKEEKKKAKKPESKSNFNQNNSNSQK